VGYINGWALNPRATEKGVTSILQQHKALQSEEPESGEHAVAKRFVERVLSEVPQETIHKTRVQRHRIGLQVIGVLGEPDNLESDLTEDERSHLSTLVEFTHPTAAMKTGIAEYVLSAC
jgi:hypothetical protein